jgi:hypothetical protein
MKRTYITLYTILAAMTVFLSSCLKSESTFTDFSKAGTLVELPLAAYKGLGKTAAYSLPLQAAAQVIPVTINVASPQPLSKDLKVTLAVDGAALTALNNTNIAKYKADSTAAANDPTGATAEPTYPLIYTQLPAAFYNIPSLSATVPANQRTAIVNVNVVTQNFDLLKNYVLPLTIVDASGQPISNYKTLFLYVQAKNQYDGVYHASGVRHHPTLGDFTFDYDVTMSTSGPNSIDGGALADLKTDLDLQVNSDNTVTPTSTYQPLFIPAGTTNTYDPATKTFTINVAYNTGAPRIMVIKLVKK